MTEAETLRERLRTDLYCNCRPHPDAPHNPKCSWANAVAKVYDLERQCEARQGAAGQ